MRRVRRNLYPSPRLTGVGSAFGIPADGHDDLLCLRGFAGGGGWHDAVAFDAPACGTSGCNNADLDHNEGRDKTPPGREESDTHVDERLWNK